jgi:sterol desaturase/sphingolipid hydroxylase (fatty acid hydroxylase superfamily)
MPLLLAAAALAIACGELGAPLRRPTQRLRPRILSNLMLGAASMAVIAAVERPAVEKLARRAEQRRQGLAQILKSPAWGRDLVAVLLMDYTIYLWHVLTHKVPLLWRFHLVHHIDLDLDASTALRFHALDMLVSIPWRAAQVVLLGVSPRALRIWQSFFFLSVLFHHSNLRLPAGLERVLAAVLTTPRMHGIHHSARKDETGSNWSSGFSLWDHLHGTFRMDVPQSAIHIGVPAYRDPEETRFPPSLAMPFHRQRDAWKPSQNRS